MGCCNLQEAEALGRGNWGAGIPRTMTQHQEVGIMQNRLRAALAHSNMSQAQSCGYKYIK